MQWKAEPCTCLPGCRAWQVMEVGGPPVCSTATEDLAALIAALPDALRSLEELIDNQPLTALTTEERHAMLLRAEEALSRAGVA